jgi:YD repeat-containing protein
LSLLATWVPASQQVLASTSRHALWEPEPAGLVAQATPPSLTNGGFETPSLSNGFQYSPSGASWTFASAGVAGNSSAFTNGNPAAPEGSQVAFIQGGGAYISQQVSGFQIGTKYVITFSTAQRGNCCNAGGLDFQVLIDNTPVGTFKPLSTNYVAAAANIFTATGGTHTLKFVGVNSSGGDNTAFIDNIQISPATQPPPVSAANSGFESPVVGNSFQYSPAGTPWTFVGAGVAGNSSPFTNGNPAAPEGSQVAFIQGGGAYVSQMLSSFRAGVSYSVSFKAAQRGNCCNAGGLDVDVYLDSTLLGSFKPAGATYADMSTAPFTTTAGPHVLKFVGRNTSGGDNTALLDSVSITRLTSNEPPAVGVTGPSNGAVYMAPADVTITADASDGDGQVAKVEFFQNGTKIGEDLSSPFSLAWSSVPKGSYTLTAKATDDLGALTTSDSVAITVNPEKGGIAGRITGPDGVTPVAGATVKLYRNNAVVSTLSTVATGDYDAPHLDDGGYTVEVSAPEFITKSQPGVTVAPETTATVNLSLGSAISYIYDELGRLTGVIDPMGESANYSYDSVGNLQSITRSSSSQTSISGFTPTRGTAGTTVTIRGTGFSSTAGQNTVSFGGTAAIVTSSTTTRITAVVPAGAPTGPITVTSPSGSATSGAPFTIETSNAPTITGFTPASGTVGTALTITGTNFDTVLANNWVKVNSSFARVTSASTGSVTANVPVASSGRISVSTPNGTGVSSQDFLIPPPGQSLAGMEVISRMNVGESRPVTITGDYNNAMLLFDGTAGQRVYLRWSGITFGNSTLTLYNPDGSQLAAGGVWLPNSPTHEGYIGPVTLPTAGTYTLLIDPTAAGSAQLTLYDVAPDVTGPITPGGAAVNVTATTPGQNGRFTFNGTAGQRVSMKVVNTSIPSSQLSIVKPDGTTLWQSMEVVPGGSPQTYFYEPQTLPADGIYTVLIDPDLNNMGSMTVQLYDVPPNVTGMLTLNGSAAPVSITAPGQQAFLNFNGTAGQDITIRITGNTIGSASVWVYTPNTAYVTSYVIGPGDDNHVVTSLPVTGTYLLVVNPDYHLTGSLTVGLTNP